ncbi:hypothetical protein BaRGS_00004999 [Batillaria attramentaria]|uniref:Uncharacterized protein n=1 Tax=Batillaria attramentaria TaxID=370345 RepID=A0ABD0LWH6_9CAEN
MQISVGQTTGQTEHHSPASTCSTSSERGGPMSIPLLIHINPPCPPSLTTQLCRWTQHPSPATRFQTTLSPAGHPD